MHATASRRRICLTFRSVAPFGMALIGGLLLSLPAGTAASDPLPRNCAAHEVVVERLARLHGESRQAIALGVDNAVIEVFASLESGSWTIAVTRPGGPTCLVASGQAFEYLAEALPNTDPPA